MEDCSRWSLKTLAAEPHTSVLTIGCAALGEGLPLSRTQFPHVSNKNNHPRLSGGCWELSSPSWGRYQGGKEQEPFLWGPEAVGASPPPNHACLEDMPESLGRPLPAPGPELPKAGPERVRVARVTQKPAEWIQHPRGGGLYLPR